MQLADILTFSFIVFMMAVTPGPNMIYVVSRAVCQGRKAGFISLLGVGTGSCLYMLSSVFGLTAVLFAFPIVYQLLKFGGGLYLLYLAWNVLKPKGKSPFEVRTLSKAKGTKLYFMGVMTTLFNPKMAAIYLSLLPPFLHPQAGAVFFQSLTLGIIQVILGVTVNGIMMLSAHHVTRFFGGHPRALLIQRWVMGLILIFVAMHVIFT